MGLPPTTVRRAPAALLLAAACAVCSEKGAFTSAVQLGAPQPGARKKTVLAALKGVRDTAADAEEQLPEGQAFRFLDDLNPVAPENRLIDKDSDEYYTGTHPSLHDGNGQGAKFVYVPAYNVGNVEDFQEYAEREKAPENKVRCTSERKFKDKAGHSCAIYEAAQLCDSSGKLRFGSGSLADMANADGRHAGQACCVCGGGAREVLWGDPLKHLNMNRSVQGQEDKLPLKHYPLHARWDAPPDHGVVYSAPMDRVAFKFKKYFKQLDDFRELPPPKGLLAEWFPPNAGAMDKGNLFPETEPVFASLAPFIDYRKAGNRLEYPKTAGTKGLIEPETWAVRWIGNMETFISGAYFFSLAVQEYGTDSLLKIDGTEITTPAQCANLDGEEQCGSVEGCKFDEKESRCGVPGAQKPTQLKAGPHCVEVWVRTKKFASDRGIALMYKGPDTKSMMSVIPNVALGCAPSASLVGSKICDGKKMTKKNNACPLPEKKL